MGRHKTIHIVMEDGVECKKCSRCLRLKPLKDFYADPRKSDGLYSDCKACFNKGNKARRWRKYF